MGSGTSSVDMCTVLSRVLFTDEASFSVTNKNDKYFYVIEERTNIMLKETSLSILTDDTDV